MVFTPHPEELGATKEAERMQPLEFVWREKFLF